MSRERIRLAHIGLGHMHSHQKLDCVMARPEVFEPVCIVAPEEEDPNTPCMAEGLRMYPEIPRMRLEQALNAGIDAALIETDDWLMTKYAQICVDAGLHVHMDKPAGDDVAAFRRLLSTARKKHLTLQMAYMYRYNPAVMKALGLGVVQPALQSGSMRSVSRERRGAASSTYYLGADVGQALAPMAGGAVMEHFGTKAMFGSYMLPLVLGMGLYMIFTRTKEKGVGC